MVCAMIVVALGVMFANHGLAVKYSLVFVAVLVVVAVYQWQHKMYRIAGWILLVALFGLSASYAQLRLNYVPTNHISQYITNE